MHVATYKPPAAARRRRTGIWPLKEAHIAVRHMQHKTGNVRNSKTRKLPTRHPRDRNNVKVFAGGRTVSAMSSMSQLCNYTWKINILNLKIGALVQMFLLFNEG